MASAALLILSLTTVIIVASSAAAEIDDSGFNLVTESLNWPSAMSMYENFEEAEDIDGDEFSRRSLVWRTMRYYISYGALSANRIPCPPRSGRSYYTHNCFKARGPVHPYTRGCSMITRCRR